VTYRYTKRRQRQIKRRHLKICFAIFWGFHYQNTSKITRNSSQH